VRFGHEAGNGVVDVVSGQAAIDYTNRTRQTPQLPGLKGEEHAGTVERVTRTIGSFVVPFTGRSKAFGVAKAASWLGRAGRAMLAGAAVDFTMNPETDEPREHDAGRLRDRQSHARRARVRA
jgi:hypothetical protein